MTALLPLLLATVGAGACTLGVIDEDRPDLLGFPGFHVAGEQLGRYREHRVWLQGQQRLHGWQGGRYEAWLRETDLAITYWHTLWDCRWTGADAVLLRRLIGPERYLECWHPPLIPEPPPMPETPPNAAGVPP